MVRKLIFVCLSVFVFQTSVQAQLKKNAEDSNLVQFSGLLLTADSLDPIPFAYIYIPHKIYGNNYSNLDGYFSFVARLGDTVMFTHGEYKKSYMVIPDTLKTFKYNVVKLMTRDTNYFAGVSITAMPSRAIFDDIFAKMEIPNDDVQRAKDNLEREQLKEQAGNLSGADATEAYKNLSSTYANKVNYSAGQIPPITLLNPFAWAQFFEAWKRGDYKKKRVR